MSDPDLALTPEKLFRPGDLVRVRNRLYHGIGMVVSVISTWKEDCLYSVVFTRSDARLWGHHELTLLP